MNQLIRPLRHSTHSDKYWRGNSTWEFAATSGVVQVSVEELAKAAINFPLAIVSGGTATMVALMGLNGRNFYVAPDGRWLGEYLPAALRAYPFKLVSAENNQFALAVDESSGLVTSDANDMPFFDDQGEATGEIRRILDFLIKLNRGHTAMHGMVERFHALDLLEPWPLKLQSGDQVVPVEGLMRVNEARLLELSSEKFLELRSNGALSVAYAQLLSMSNIDTFSKLARFHAQHAAMSEKQQEEIKSMFVPTHVEDEIDWDAMLKGDES